MIATLLTALLLASPAAATYGGCTDGIVCREVQANELTFQCRFGGDDLPGAGVMLLHGFPEWSDMYMPLMRELASAGFRSVACNQRGYSPGASPPNVPVVILFLRSTFSRSAMLAAMAWIFIPILLLALHFHNDRTDYNYDLLASDVLAVARATNLSGGADDGRFHLVGHDHGAALGWTVAAGARGAAALRSYAALSVPHVDAFSAGLEGPDADLQQVMASQYFTMFVLNHSATLHGNFWYNTMGKTSGDADSGSFADAAAFQKALWWYNGARDAGRMAIPRVMGAGELLAHGAFSAAALRGIFGGTPTARGTPEARPVGNVSVPSLFVCGKSDSAILCDRPYSLKTRDFCTAGYKFLDVDCGHDLLACADKKVTATVTAAIVAHVKANA